MGYLYTRDSLLMVVADGMGGHARGEIASEITLQTVAAMFQRLAKPMLPDPARFLEDSISASHRELHRYRAENSLPEAPRTTVVACVIQQAIDGWFSDGVPVWTTTTKEAIEPTHEAADAFWKYWRENGETHKHGYYESTWGAINAALNASTSAKEVSK